MHSNIVVINLSEQPENEKFSSQLMVVSDIDAPLKICVAELEKQQANMKEYTPPRL